MIPLLIIFKDWVVRSNSSLKPTLTGNVTGNYTALIGEQLGLSVPTEVKFSINTFDTLTGRGTTLQYFHQLGSPQQHDDFNGDGKSDILWQNTSGQAGIWEMNGTNMIGAAQVGSNPGTSWQVKASGDFNGDGFADILWQNTNGQAGIWEMNGTNIIGAAQVGSNPGTSWQVKGSGDFNGDGFADILWQNTSGQAGIWEMNGTSVIGSDLVGPNPGPSWHLPSG